MPHEYLPDGPIEASFLAQPVPSRSATCTPTSSVRLDDPI